MVSASGSPAVDAALTGALCLVPTLAFFGLLRLLDRLRDDVLVEHTLRMAAEEGRTADGANRLDPGVALRRGESRRRGSDDGGPDGLAWVDDDGWDDPPRRELVLCPECATLRRDGAGACPECGADPADAEASGTAG